MKYIKIFWIFMERYQEIYGNYFKTFRVTSRHKLPAFLVIQPLFVMQPLRVHYVHMSKTWSQVAC